MIPSGQFAYSVIEHRANPADGSHSVLLGVVLEFLTHDMWVVSLIARDFLRDDEIASLDKLGRELLANPSVLLTQKVQKTLGSDGPMEPGDVVRLLADQNPYSIHFGEPGVLDIPDERSVEAASDFTSANMVRMIFTRKYLGSIGERDRQALPEHKPWFGRPQFWYLPAA